MLLYAQLLILIVLVILNIWFGIVKGMYGLIWWWDIPTHFLGGAWAGLFGAWLVQSARHHFFKRTFKRFFVFECALAALLIGITWEVFEVAFDIGKSIFMSHWMDTFKDLVIDTLGGAMAGYIAYLERALWRR